MYVYIIEQFMRVRLKKGRLHQSDAASVFSSKSAKTLIWRGFQRFSREARMKGFVLRMVNTLSRVGHLRRF